MTICQAISKEELVRKIRDDKHFRAKIARLFLHYGDFSMVARSINAEETSLLDDLIAEDQEIESLLDEAIVQEGKKAIMRLSYYRMLKVLERVFSLVTDLDYEGDPKLVTQAANIIAQFHGKAVLEALKSAQGEEEDEIDRLWKTLKHGETS